MEAVHKSMIQSVAEALGKLPPWRPEYFKNRNPSSEDLSCYSIMVLGAINALLITAHEGWARVRAEPQVCASYACAACRTQSVNQLAANVFSFMSGDVLWSGTQG